MIKEKLKLVNQYISLNKEEILKDWQEIVEIESYTKDIEGVTKVVLKFKDLLEKEGFKCNIIDAKPNGPTLIGTMNEELGQSIIFSGHLDTVHPKGKFKKDLFIIKEDKVFGPGVLDMKGGLIIALYVVKALKHIGCDDIPFKFIVSGDEEIGHLNSKGANIIKNEAKNGLFAFNMETGRIDNSFCIGRKGCITCDIIVEGISSHAGNDFLAGRNAIEEMAYKIVEIRKLIDIEIGTTINTGLIEGGSIVNAVPSYCKISLDIRYSKISEEKRIKKALKEIVENSTIDKTKSTINYTIDFAMYETNENVNKMYEYVCSCAREFGYRVSKSIILGGGSDAAYINLAQTPVICAFGVLGQWNHTLDEYALIDSMYERIELISALILNKEKF